MPPPGEMSPHVGQQGLNPGVCNTKGRAASESQALNDGDVTAWSQAAAGTTDPQTEGLKSFFPLLELSPEAMPLIQVLPWWSAIAKRTPFMLQPWCAFQPVHAWGKALP